MRPSSLKHTLAVLRTFLGLGQKQMADLVDRSARTIQAVELGQLPLSDELAKDIARETGVSIKWLLDGDTSKAPESDESGAYTQEHFDHVRAANTYPFGALPNDKVRLGLQLNTILMGVTVATRAAIDKDKWPLFHYKLGKAVQDLLREFGGGSKIKYDTAQISPDAKPENLEKVIQEHCKAQIDVLFQWYDARASKLQPQNTPKTSKPSSGKRRTT